jgi:hypothetical protein
LCEEVVIAKGDIGLMKTGCTAEQLEFHGLGRRVVVGEFNGGAISSDSGGLSLRESD